MIGPGVQLRAPAKVNLTLRVLERREDGFHELDTLFQAVDLCDLVRIVRTGDELRLDVHGADLGPVEENLAFRAAAEYLAAARSDQGVRIELVKRIPAGGGLGGGSSDAAAVLRGLDLLVGGVSPEERYEIAAGLGSDVPFFLGDSPTAWGSGRGERLVNVEPLPVRPMLLGLPPVHVATGPAYGRLAAAREAGASASRAHEAGDRPTGWGPISRVAVNDFEAVVAPSHPEVQETLNALRGVEADLVLMSGSGAACFAVLEEGRDAEGVANVLSASLGWPVLAARTLPSWPDPEGYGARG